MYQITRNIRSKYGVYMRSNFSAGSVGYINTKYDCCGKKQESNPLLHWKYNIYKKNIIKHCYYKDNHRVGYKHMPAYFCSHYGSNWTSHRFVNSLDVSTRIQRHSFHTSPPYYDEDSKDKLKVLDHDEKSKIEEYVEHQKEKLEKKRKIIAASQKFQEAFIFKVDTSLMPTSEQGVCTAQTSDGIVQKKPMLTSIIDGLKHYYKGFKLLYLDTKIAARLMWNIMNGKMLSRREKKQFLRTVADLFRLVPFMVFLIIPFMEFLLPVAIKLFPGMLPSTFEDAKTKENKRRLSLKMRLRMAEFLQDTIEEISVSSKEKGKKPNKKLKQFAKFVKKTRTESDPPSNEEIMEFSKLFEDELTLENIPHDHLKALCRIMMISPIGTSNFLRFKIRLKLQELKADDQMIRREGIESLSNEELQIACTSRGMRSLGVSVDRLKSNLKQWLELSLDQKIPASLLLLSRTFYMQYDRVDEQLKLTISQLPERLIDEMELKIGAVEGEAVDRQTIIDIIKHEEEQIKTEKLERDKEKAEDEKLKQRELVEPTIIIREEQLSKEELLTVKETLSVSDKEKLDKIKGEREEYIEDVEELKQVQKDAVENVASTRLGKRIDAMLKKVDKSLKILDEEVSHLPVDKIDEDEDGVVTTQELSDAISKLHNAPDQAKTQRLLKVMDDDNDGVIDLDEMRIAVKLLASEDLDLNQLQIMEMLSLLKNTERIFIIEQMLNKRKTNYLIRLLPLVYSRRNVDFS